MTDDLAVAATWSTPEWRREATDWLDQSLAATGLERIGPVAQPHVEPWSTVLSAETDMGRIWLKAMVPGTAFEIALYDLLVQVEPDHVLHPIASDEERGWLLLPDGGPSLAERLTGDELVSAMVGALPQYAFVQRTMTPTTDTIIELGLSDLRPGVLQARFRDALARLDGEPYADRLRSLEGDFGQWCDVVSRSPLRPTLDHNDLHPWNILGGNPTLPGGTGSVVFYDWGDSVVAHPLGSAHIPISRVRRMVGLDAGHPDVLRMRDAYLEVFTDLVTGPDLIELFEVSCRLARATRAVVWDGSPEDVGRYLGDLDDGFGSI